MDAATLKRMLTQISDYYAAYPQDEAISGIAGHLKAFWEPRMRTDLLKARASGDCEDLPEAAQKAIDLLDS